MFASIKSKSDNVNDDMIVKEHLYDRTDIYITLNLVLRGQEFETLSCDRAHTDMFNLERIHDTTAGCRRDDNFM